MHTLEKVTKIKMRTKRLISSSGLPRIRRPYNRCASEESLAIFAKFDKVKVGGPRFAGGSNKGIILAVKFLRV